MLGWLRAGKQFSLRILSAALLLAASKPVWAHAGDQAFVLLLPTGIYTAAGVSAVAATILILAVFPKLAGSTFFSPVDIVKAPSVPGGTVVSLAAFALLCALIWIGLTGSRDPLSNPMPLFVWTVWWVGLVSLSALLGNFWSTINPWTGPHRLVSLAVGHGSSVTLPNWIGSWVGIVTFCMFALFLLADISPTDPARVAVVVAAYGLATLLGMALFGGSTWLSRCEGLTMLMRHYASIAPIGIRSGHLCIGMPGWKVAHSDRLSLSTGIFVLLLLGTGSFDGLNETFWWLDLLGINPLEFPGRSAVVWQTVVGFFIANIVLVAAFIVCIWSGLLIAGSNCDFETAFGRLVVSILPIAAGYHVAHYLTAFLVDGQYAVAAMSDPLSNGSDLLGLGTFYVTTGFFNTRTTVQIIWLTQAGFIVIGHVLSVLIAHAIAKDLLADTTKAVLALVPLSAFMVLYTMFGLWLLASPRGA